MYKLRQGNTMDDELLVNAWLCMKTFYIMVDTTIRPVLLNLMWIISLVSADHTGTLNTLTSHPSTVNEKTFTGNVVTRSRSKEDNGTLEIFRGSPSAGRDTFENLTSSVLVCYESLVHLQNRNYVSWRVKRKKAD